MKQSVVAAVIYKVRPGPYIVLDSPAPISFATSDFRIALDEGELRIDLVAPVETVEEARSLADPYVRSWEIRSGLTRGTPEVQFEYVRPEFVDLDPHGTGPDKLISVSASASVSFEAVTQWILHDYPDAPHDFVADPDVEVMWQRYQNYRSGNEPLLSMAYFCLSNFEVLVGPSRKTAAVNGHLDPSILSKLGEFTSTGGSKLTARKIIRHFKGQALDNKEAHWVDSCVRLLIRRLGELRAGVAMRPLSMHDLPKL